MWMVPRDEGLPLLTDRPLVLMGMTSVRKVDRLQKVFFCSTKQRRYDRSLRPKKLTGFPMDPSHDIPAVLPDSEPIESTFRSVETKPILDGDLWGTHVRTGITIIPQAISHGRA
jgi:hypothetical protein